MEEWRPPEELLDVPAGADVATIRRAYARKLRTVRPDENPSAFQALVEARDQLLRQAAWRRDVEGDVDEGTGTTAQEDPQPEAAIRAIGAQPEPAGETEPIAPPDTPGIRSAVSLPAPSSSPEAPVAATDDAHEAVVQPDDIVDALQHGLEPNRWLDADDLDAMLVRLPAGALRWYEADIVTALADAAQRLGGSEPFPPSTHDAYERAFCRFHEHFAWEERDRPIHATLSGDGLRIFLVFLRRALVRHVPGYDGRFNRIRPAASESTGSSWFSWRSMAFWWVLIVLVTNITRCVGQSATPLPPAQPTISR